MWIGLRAKAECGHASSEPAYGFACDWIWVYLRCGSIHERLLGSDIGRIYCCIYYLITPRRYIFRLFSLRSKVQKLGVRANRDLQQVLNASPRIASSLSLARPQARRHRLLLSPTLRGTASASKLSGSSLPAHKNFPKGRRDLYLRRPPPSKTPPALPATSLLALPSSAPRTPKRKLAQNESPKGQRLPRTGHTTKRRKTLLSLLSPKKFEGR
jgi:hypothetical protein